MRNLASLSLLIVPLLALTSCRSLPEVPGSSVHVLYSEGGMSAKNPVDIVIVPVSDETGTGMAPCDMLRSAFADALVRRRYSPLSLDYVSSALEGQAIAAAEAGTPVPASYNPGTLGEDAALRVSVKTWDMSALQSQEKIVVSVEAWMIDSVDPLSKELWGARYEKTLDMALMKNKYPTESVLMKHCCEMIAAEIMDSMPARTSRAGI